MVLRRHLTSAVTVALLVATATSAEERRPVPPMSEAPEAPPRPAPPAAPERETFKLLRIAIYDLDLGGLDERVGQIYMDSLAIELRKLRAVDVVTMDDIRTMLGVEADKQMLGCDDGDSCLAEIADALGADVILSGSIATVGEERVVGLVRIEQATASVTERVQMRLAAADGEELLASVGPAVEKLFKDRELKEGLSRGVDESMALRLNPPPLPPWAFWTTLATGGGLVGLGSMLAIASLPPWLETQALLEQSAGKDTPASAVRSSYDLGNAAFLSAQLTAGLGAIALTTAGVMFFFTDFDGVGE